MRLLAVDDDPLVLDLLPVVFAQADLPKLDLAHSAAEALELLSDLENVFDCLLLDIQMPDVDGIELCRRIRKLPLYANTPIVMLTSVTDHSEIERAFAAGANDYVTKPFDVKEITTRVRVAQRMSETAGDAPHLDPKELPQDGTPGKHGFRLDEPLRLARRDQLVLPFSLGNYLSQLSRRRLDSCMIFGAKLEDIGGLYDRCNSREFATALSEITNAIVLNVETPNLLMSYEGDGKFLCITQGAAAPKWPEIEDLIHDTLSQRAPRFEDGTPMNLDLSVGNPIPPYASRNQRVKKTFERALGRAEMRSRSKETGSRPSSRPI